MNTELAEQETAIGIAEDPGKRTNYLVYFGLPAVFLAVTLLGGLRFGIQDNAFIFLVPPLVCLVLGAAAMVLFVRSGLISSNGWLSQENALLVNAARGGVLLTLFAASTQVFNSLLPEQGLPFWVIGFCFVWTLWNNLFSEFDASKLVKSLAALFAIAFAAKYLILANLVSPSEGGWFQRLLENPGKETITWLLDLPKFSRATGYAQFFTIVLYLAGLYLTPNRVDDH